MTTSVIVDGQKSQPLYTIERDVKIASTLDINLDVS